MKFLRLKRLLTPTPADSCSLYLSGLIKFNIGSFIPDKYKGHWFADLCTLCAWLLVHKLPCNRWSLLRNAQWFEYDTFIFFTLLFSLFCMYWQCSPLAITVFCVIVSFSPHSVRVWESFSLSTSASFVPLWAGGSDNIVKESCTERRNMTHVYWTFSPVSRTESWHGAVIRPYLLRALLWPWVLLLVIVLCVFSSNIHSAHHTDLAQYGELSFFISLNRSIPLLIWHATLNAHNFED